MRRPRPAVTPKEITPSPWPAMRPKNPEAKPKTGKKENIRLIIV